MHPPSLYGPTVEAAVRRGNAQVPKEYLRILHVEYAPNGQEALALVLLDAHQHPYFQLSACELDEAGWQEVHSDHADGSVPTVRPHSDTDLWRSVIFGEAPAHAQRVNVRHHSGIQSAPVVLNHFLSAAWFSDGAAASAPRILGFETSASYGS